MANRGSGRYCPVRGSGTRSESFACTYQRVSSSRGWGYALADGNRYKEGNGVEHLAAA